MTKYYKITNEAENHNGFQYVTGLNVLKEPFNDNPKDSCCAGGLYFSDIKNIFEFLNYGVYLREVILPTDDPSFKMIRDKEGNKWRANMIILGDRFKLSDVATYEYLIENGAHINIKYVLEYASINGYFEVIKYLMRNCDTTYGYKNYLLVLVSRYGHLQIVKYLTENGANVRDYDYLALKYARYNCHTDIVKYLIKNGGDAHTGHFHYQYALKDNY